MIKVSNVEVLENPSNFLEPFQFKITFIADEDLKNNEYEWKVVYVGSAESKDFDQILLSESLHGSYNKGQHVLVLRSAPVDPDKIPEDELLAPSVVLLVGCRNHKQFFQVGFLVTKDYLDEQEPAVGMIEYDRIQKTVHQNTSRVVLVDDDDDNTDSEPAVLSEALRKLEMQCVNEINSFLQSMLQSK